MNYKQRLKSYVEKGYDTSTIQKLIYTEYGIRLKKRSVQKSRPVEEDGFLRLLYTTDDIKEDFKNDFTKDFFDLKGVDDRIKNLVRIVLRDNVITKIEKEFLDRKFEELGLDDDNLNQINTFLYSNNPYYDETFELIWADKLIEDNEIFFLKEKCKENNHNQCDVNKRFWQYSIKYNFEDLLLVESFRKIVKLYFILTILKVDNPLKYFFPPNNVVNGCLNLFEFNDSDSFELVIQNAKDELEVICLNYLEKSGYSYKLRNLYQMIDLDFKSEHYKEKIDNDDEAKELLKGNYYTKSEIYSLFNVNELQQGGKWNNGYCKHNEEWFIFCNINSQGFGYQGQMFDYSNTFDSEGHLNWEARYGSKIYWNSIEQLSNSSPYIFTKENNNTSKWLYSGKGTCISISDLTPVRIKWGFSENEVVVKSDHDGSKNVKKVPKPKSDFDLKKSHFEEVILLNKTNRFKAFEVYKKTILSKFPKTRPRKIRDGFNKLIEELG